MAVMISASAPSATLVSPPPPTMNRWSLSTESYSLTITVGGSLQPRPCAHVHRGRSERAPARHRRHRRHHRASGRADRQRSRASRLPDQDPPRTPQPIRGARGAPASPSAAPPSHGGGADPVPPSAVRRTPPRAIGASTALFHTAALRWLHMGGVRRQRFSADAYSSPLHPRILCRVGVHGRATVSDGLRAQFVVPRLVAVDLAQPVRGAAGGQPRRGGGSDVDRVPRHVSRRVGGGHPSGSFLF